jgi:class 3 adenylate cyclase
MAGLLSYSLQILGRGVRHEAQLVLESKTLACYYDIAKRIINTFALPKTIQHVPSFIALGNRLYDLSIENGLLLKGAAFGRSAQLPRVIRKAIESTFSFPLPAELDMAKLVAQRIVWPESGTIRRAGLIESAEQLAGLELKQAFNTLANRDLQADYSLEEKIRERDEFAAMVSAIDQMHAISGRSSIKRSHREDLVTMLDIITNVAWRIIGKSSHSESAGWLITDSEGNIGTPLKYVVYQPGERLKDAKVLPVRVGAPKSKEYLTIPDAQTIEQIDDQRGSYITVREWENFGDEFGGRFREDFVIRVNEIGQRELCRRIEHPSSEFYHLLAEAKLGTIAGTSAEIISGLITQKAAFYSLEQVDPQSPALGLKPGDIIRIIPKGTNISLVAAGSADPDVRNKKISQGKELERNFLEQGMPIGLVTQDSKDIGNIARCLDRLIGLTVKDARHFNKPQNLPMIYVVRAASYTIWPIYYCNDNNEVIMVGAIQTTNPEKLPAAGFEKQFSTHQRFGRLVADQVTTRVQQQMLDKRLRESLGPQIYSLVKAGKTDLLKPRKIDNVSTLFVDMSGFTKLSEMVQDPNEINSLLANFFRILDPNVFRFSGMVDKHIGDCQMAVWGVFDDKEDNAERSLSTAIKHQRAIQALNSSPEMQSFFEKFPQVPPLGITVGISTGTVTASNIGEAEGKIEYTVNSPTVNLAARLQSLAKKSQILIDDATFTRLSQEFKDNFARDFNQYNRDRSELKPLIRKLLKINGYMCTEETIDKLLDKYEHEYKDIKVEGLYEEGTITTLKNIDRPVKYFSWRWDRHSYRDQYLQSVLKDGGFPITQL